MRSIINIGTFSSETVTFRKKCAFKKLPKRQNISETGKQCVHMVFHAVLFVYKQKESSSSTPVFTSQTPHI